MSPLITGINFLSFFNIQGSQKEWQSGNIIIFFFSDHHSQTGTNLGTTHPTLQLEINRANWVEAK